MKSLQGPVFKYIDNILNEYSFYHLYRSGQISHEEYAIQLDVHANILQEKGIPKSEVHFSSRFPTNVQKFIQSCLIDLFAKNLISEVSYDEEQLESYVGRMDVEFDHAGYHTFIYPEEAQLLYALTSILKPKSVAFLGSYYGYWAFWSLPLLQKFGGQAYLVDINDEVNKVAQRNIINFGYESCAKVITADATTFSRTSTEMFDLIVIDAEGSKNDPDLERCGKRIYHPILKEALKKLRPGGKVVFHNILLNNFRYDPYFDFIISHNKTEFMNFLSLVSENFDLFLEYQSTEGIGVAVL